MRGGPSDGADGGVAVWVAGGEDMCDGGICSRFGMAPRLNAAGSARKGTLAVVLLDGHSEKGVWSSAIQLASDVPVAEEARGQLSQQLAAQLLGSLPSD